MRTCTVIIPAYNADPDALNRALARLLLMPLAKRIVVVDDGSETPLTDEQGPLSATRVTLLRQDNAGVSVARNTGIDLALVFAEPILFLDADDEPRDGIASALDLLHDLDAGAVVSAREERNHEGVVKPKPVPAEWAGRTLPHAGDVFRPIALFGASGLLVDHRVLKGNLRFDPALSHGEDRDLLRRIGERAPIGVNPEVALSVTLHHEDAQNLTSAAHDVRRAKAMCVLAERWLDEHSEPHFRESARWLLSRVAKRRSPEEAWRTLVDLHRAQSWRIPLKARLRRLFSPGVS